ncbi:MAG: hypothetical protein ABI473_06095, partial [Candidatus Dormibacter sp.]
EGGWTLVHTEDGGILALSPVVGVQTPLRVPGPVVPGTLSADGGRLPRPGTPSTDAAGLLPPRTPLPPRAPAHTHRAREPALPPA